MDIHDDDLIEFEARGQQLPPEARYGYVDHDGARIAYTDIGSGEPVILLHGGLGHSGNWGKQVPALVAAGYRAIAIDSRGHGRSTRDARPYSYELMGTDVFAVMDALSIPRATILGWSDGACTALIMADHVPDRITGVFYFGCNMDSTGTKEIEWPNTVIERCFSRHKKDYATLSSTPDQFDAFVEAVSLMEKTQPNYTASDLARIRVPVLVVHSERDEFIRAEHARYLADTIPGAGHLVLPGVSHFAPLQRPDLFNEAMLAFISKVSAHHNAR